MRLLPDFKLLPLLSCRADNRLGSFSSTRISDSNDMPNPKTLFVFIGIRQKNESYAELRKF